MMKMHKLVLLVVALAISSANAAAAATVRMQLVHTDAGRSLTTSELLHRMAQRSKARAERLLSQGTSFPVTPGQINNGVPDTEYLAHFAMGTPPQPVQLDLDTGSSLIWTQCQPCVSCFSQIVPYFDPSNSSTFAVLPCHSPMCLGLDFPSCGRGTWGNHTCVYAYAYADNSITTGQLAADTFTFAAAADGTGRASVPGLAFGCGLFNNGIFESNETGIAGFGRGALSLPSQLKVDNFSYCFTDITGSEPSTVLLGLPADLHSNSSGVVQSTPLIQSSSSFPNEFYYVSLKGISVGSMRLPILESAFTMKENGTGGTIIDSGTGMTSLPQNAYNMVTNAFVAQTRLPVVNSTASSLTQLCFMVPSGAKPEVPKLVFHFEGAALDLPRENYMFDIQDAGGNNLTCLAINAGGEMAIIGNYQQQNMHVFYDLPGNKLSFVPARCSKL